MTPRAQLMAAVAAGIAEYLAVSVLFDARELVPRGLMGIGELAPIPIIIGVALLILRVSARAEHQSLDADRPARPEPAGSKLAAALLLVHLGSFAAFLLASFQLRARHDSGADAVALELAWATLAGLVALSLVAFALAGGLRAVVRRLAGPLAVGSAVGVAAWAAGQGTGELWRPLSRATLAPIAAIVSALSSDAVVDVQALVVGTERFSVRIDPVCSGYEGMGLVAVLLAAYLWSFRAALRFPHALILPLAAVLLAFLANVVRITALLYVGALVGPEVAMGGFHSKAGWLLFCAIALGTVAVARRARMLQRPDARGEQLDSAGDNPSAAYLMPLLALVAGTLFTGLASDGNLDHLELLAVASAVIALAVWRAPLREALTARGALTARPALVAIATGVAVFVLWIALDQPSPDASEPTRAQLDAWSPALAGLWLATRVVASVLVVPVVEELAFRGFLLRRVMSADFTAIGYRQVTLLAVLVSAVAFGALHDRFFAGTIAGFAYAATSWRTGRLRDAVLAHLVTNALIAALVLGGGRWSLWH